MMVEFHIVPDEEMNFDAILGRIILDVVDRGTEVQSFCFEPNFKEESRVPRLSDTHYSAGCEANAKFHHVCGISIDIGKYNKK